MSVKRIHYAIHRARNQEIVSLYQSGQTLEAIGQQFNLTRQRVQQILKDFNLSRPDGGVSVRRLTKQTEKDARYIARWGHTFKEHKRLLAIGRELMKQGESRERTPIFAFRRQRQNARARGIEWNLTLAQWWAIWGFSGKWSKRGLGRDRYVMSRHSDTGPYSVENCFIQESTDNNSDTPHKTNGLPKGVRRVPTKSVRSAKHSRYWATKMINGNQTYLGRFDTAEEASEAYEAAS